MDHEHDDGWDGRGTPFDPLLRMEHVSPQLPVGTLLFFLTWPRRRRKRRARRDRPAPRPARDEGTGATE
jgi:hypothetical protein